MLIYENLKAKKNVMNKQNLENNKSIINCLYSHFKNTPEKLKIICDWDEVIQAHESYAYWEVLNEEKMIDKENYPNFSVYFKKFWEKGIIEYSPYGSKLKTSSPHLAKKQEKSKYSENHYQKTPFLTIAKELLKLIKENKVEKVIFLSAYNKKVFPNGDGRKKQIFAETFGKYPNCSLQLVGFDSEKQGANKADWIKENAANFDIVIDDNPNILRNVIENNKKIIACAPFYPAVKSKHQESVLLIETSISNLKKEEFLNINNKN